MAMNSRNLGIVSIATNKYLDYWKKQVTSLDTHVNDFSEITVFLFTDRTLDAIQHSKSLNRVQVRVIQIPNYGWPEATLLRYELMSKNFSELITQDVLVYLDADMRVVSPLNSEIFFNSEQPGVILVRHPGFWRPSGLSRFAFYLANPKVLVADAMAVLRVGGLGSWETKPQSKAFVARKNRKKYYCGGIWWGSREEFRGLVDGLSSQVATDSSNGVIAKWHDESHLNHWATVNKFSENLPSVCFAEGYKWLENIEPLIVAVDKGEVSR
jgi:hypothetical protein